MAIKISHSHFVHVAFVSILVFQTFDRMIFGTLTFPGTRWYVMTARDIQWYATRKSLRTTGVRGKLADNRRAEKQPFEHARKQRASGPERTRRTGAT